MLSLNSVTWIPLKIGNKPGRDRCYINVDVRGNKVLDRNSQHDTGRKTACSTSKYLIYPVNRS